MPASFTVTKGTVSAGAARLRAIGGRIRVALANAAVRIGPELTEAAVEAMRSAKPGLHPYTVAMKGSSVPLAGGALEAALTHRIETTPRGVVVWFGVPRSAGAELLMIAKVQEFGITIDVTPKMRGYLAATGLHLRADTTSIVIPPRPFISTALDRVRARRSARGTILDELKRAFRG
jgi:hypothetical protein